MLMVPEGEWPANLKVTEEPAGDVVGVLGDPPYLKRKMADLQHNSSPISNGASPFHDLDFVPGRIQELERIRPFVPGENTLDRCMNPRSFLKNLTHTQLDERGRPDEAKA